VLERSIICFVFFTSYARSLAQYDGFLLDQKHHFYRKIFLALLIVAIPIIAVCWISGGILSIEYFWIIPACFVIYSITLRNLACGAFAPSDFLSIALLLVLIVLEWYLFENLDILLATGISLIAITVGLVAVWFSPSGRKIRALIRSRHSSKTFA
jgi:accessory gene regulator protein AgrB